MHDQYPKQQNPVQIDLDNGRSLHVNAIGPVVEEASGVHSYPVTELKYEETEYSMGWGEQSVQPAIDYASEVLPNRQFTLLSNEGSTAVILQDENGLAYKVGRGAHDNYGYDEEEMAKLVVCHELGIAPEPIILIDAAYPYRKEAEGGTRRSFADVPIRRVEAQGPYPILVMQKIDALPEDQFGRDEIHAEFDRIFQVVTSNGLSCFDTELVIDAKTRKMLFVDCGGITKPTSFERFTNDADGNQVDSDRFEGIPDDKVIESKNMSYLLLHFSEIYWKDGDAPNRMIGFKDVYKLYAKKGLEGLHEYLDKKWDDRIAAREPAQQS